MTLRTLSISLAAPAVDGGGGALAEVAGPRPPWRALGEAGVGLAEASNATPALCRACSGEAGSALTAAARATPTHAAVFWASAGLQEAAKGVRVYRQGERD